MKIAPLRNPLETSRMRANALCVLLLGLVAACSDPSARSSAQPAPKTPTLAAGPLPDPARRAPTDAVSMKQSFAPIVRKAAPAVVNI